MYTALTATLVIALGAAWLAYTAISRWNQRRWMYGEYHGSFQQAVVAKRILLYKQLKSKRPRRWTPQSLSYVPASSFSLAYQDAVERIRLENDVAKCQQRIDDSVFVKSPVVDRLISAQDQHAAFMKRWNNGMLMPKPLASDHMLL